MSDKKNDGEQPKREVKPSTLLAIANSMPWATRPRYYEDILADEAMRRERDRQ